MSSKSKVNAYVANKPTEHITKLYGVCIPKAAALRIIIDNGGWPQADRDALVFTYPGQTERRVEPVFLNGVGWLYPQRELERNDAI